MKRQDFRLRLGQRADVALSNVAVTLTGVSGDSGPVRSVQARPTMEVAKSPSASGTIFFIPSCLIVVLIAARI